MWQMILSLPQRIIQLVQQTLSFIGRALTNLIQALTSLLQALPRILEAAAEAVVRGLVELAHFLFIEVPLNLLRGLWDLTTRVVRALLIDLPRYVFNTLVEFVRTVREVVGELVRFVVQLPGQVWRLVVFLTTTLPREMARVVADIVRTLWEPTMVVLTWVLALVIAPFYFLARLLGLVGPGPLSRGGK
jgi:phage-related protein